MLHKEIGIAVIGAGRTPEELQQVMSAEFKRWSAVIMNAGIIVDAPR